MKEYVKFHMKILHFVHGNDGCYEKETLLLINKNNVAKPKTQNRSLIQDSEENIFLFFNKSPFVGLATLVS
jgi:hypothetical protein